MRHNANFGIFLLTVTPDFLSKNQLRIYFRAAFDMLVFFAALQKNRILP